MFKMSRLINILYLLSPLWEHPTGVAGPLWRKETVSLAQKLLALGYIIAVSRESERQVNGAYLSLMSEHGRGHDDDDIGEG